MIMRSALESLDKAFSNSPQRLAAYHIKAHNPRTLITVFGSLVFVRTVYSDKHDKSKFFTYLDSVLGIPKYIQYDPCIRALLIESYLSINSMQKAGQLVGERIGNWCFSKERKLKHISKQTVAYIIHKLPAYQFPYEKREHTPEVIYVMADEKYIALQYEPREDGKAKKHMTKVAVIFEGVHKLNGQYRLINSHYVIGHEQSFWECVQDRLYELYDYDLIKHIIIMGDGATWIRSGKPELRTDITNTEFLLDKFHTMQAVKHISITYESALRYYVQEDMKKDFIMMVEFIKKQYDENRCEKIDAKASYLLSNWDAIQYMYKKSSFGCSMESHIQHALASKLSEVPRGFKREHLQRLVKLIAHYENGVDMIQLYLKGLSCVKDGVVVLYENFDFGMFDKKPDGFDKGSTGRSIARSMKAISSGKYH